MSGEETYKKLQLGSWADEILKHMGEPKKIERVGEDSDGFIVEWRYDDVIFTLARATVDDKLVGELTVYAIQKIERL